jgi:4-amino-4-deoxy-L-arabinose transferase-like glycosyltransferase
MGRNRIRSSFRGTVLSVLKQNIDLVIVLLVISGFVLVASQRLGEAPIPDTDESMTLQVPYEMLFRGKLAFPMYRFLGGNIENVWHSYTPVFFVMLSGFFKVFGWGLLQGRAFNLVMAALLLLIVHLIARKLLNRRAGLIAVVALVSDPTFLDRSRLMRNDFAGAMFALLAFYLYETARQRKKRWFYVASGLAAGAGAMCHTNVLYSLALVGSIMILDRGWRVVRSGALYQFAAGAFAAMAFEVIYDIVDYKNFLLQNRQDEQHFAVLSGWGWWANLKQEITRYHQWYNGSLKFDAPLTLLHIFMFLTIVAVAYLTLRFLLRAWRRDVVKEPRTRILLATAVVVLFFATVTQRKVVFYTVHIAPWFALCVGILLSDGWTWMGRILRGRFRWSKLARTAAIACAALLTVAFTYELFRQTGRYLRNVSDPQLASFEEFRDALRAVVPEDVCPIAFKSGFLWLAFPEKDQCFAVVENRMKDAVDVAGKEYAVIVIQKHFREQKRLAEKLTRNAHLLGELIQTPYGTIQVYYTGTDQRYLSQAPKRFYFFGKRRGTVSEEQVAAAPAVWSADGNELRECTGLADAVVDRDGLLLGDPRQSSRADGFIELCPIKLMPETIYRVSANGKAGADAWTLVVVEEKTGVRLEETAIGASDGMRSVPRAPQAFDGVFRTRKNDRVVLGALPRAEGTAPAFHISRISISEVSSTHSPEKR